ncbi:unnamed protein product [Arctia plantaginis]|uniref:Uncharacterized protein n=1 Tax=Arctia plantaginis TaxID=874455 RepID=A0A8S0ZKW1_ARCPL|nr:unnamed protein product [Arctia plantaginis]
MYLGVYISEHLSCHPHIETLWARTRELVYIVKELRYSADSETQIKAFACPFLPTASLRLKLPVRPYYFRLSDPTTLLYSECRVLTVRQLYILRTVLRLHSSLPLDNSVRQKGTAVCATIPCCIAFVSRQSVYSPKCTLQQNQSYP